MIVDGQVHGGIAQGVGQALFEEAVYDEDGNLVTGSLLNYLVPSAAELPSFELGRTETPSPTNPLGVKGVGETGAIASPAAVMNAVVDALRPSGVEDRARCRRPRSGSGVRSRRRRTMIPDRFEYELAGSVEQAVELLASTDGAKLLAGGHSLLPLMRLRIARPTLLVDVGRLDELSYVREDGDRVAIGALTRHHDLAHDPLLRERCGIVAHTASLIGDPQVRHRGTVGGSVAHGDPAADMPAVLVALEADLAITGPAGDRTVPASEFFTGVFETAIGPADLLREIRVPVLAGGWSYLKFNRRAQDWATVGVAAVRSNGGARIALTNMGPTPIRATAVEQALADGADPTAAATHAAQGTNPPSDTAGSADYRRHLAATLVRRALNESAVKT